MKREILSLLICVGILSGCQGSDSDADAGECVIGETISCGSGLCRGTSECTIDGWTPCSSSRRSCGICCVCGSEGNESFDCEECGDQDGDGYLSLECGGGDCDDLDHRVYPERWDECDGIDNDCDSAFDEDEAVTECGENVCTGEQYCVGGEFSQCSTYGLDCGPCCRCTAEGMLGDFCSTCEEGDVIECGTGECWGTRFCLGDSWSNCSSAGDGCGTCCVCNENGNPEEICASCEDGDVEICGADDCSGYRVCVGDSWGDCSTFGDDCGHCCECNEFGHAVTICSTCEEGETELCGSGDCSGYRVCVGDSWSACSTEGRSCGTCCVCDADGASEAICDVCEEGDIRACGSGDCAGYQLCLADSWGECSSRGLDCGVCCICSESGLEAYDASQDSDCPDFDCPAYSGCEYGWVYCGTHGDHVHVELTAHTVMGVCNGLEACGHEECYTGEWKVCENDSDGDRYSESCGDCDDSDPTVYTGAAEICGDFIDNDCDGVLEEGCCLDWDGDGHIDATCGGDDCNDSDPAVYPGALEICDGQDNDCDGGNDNLESWSAIHRTSTVTIPSSKCSTDPCCSYTTHREPGLAYSMATSGIDFMAINPASINLTADAERLYYASTAYSDARIEYRVNYSASGTLTQGYNFRSPTHSACGSLFGTPGANNPQSFSTSGTDVPLSVEWWVPNAGDYGVSLKNFEVEITMSCY